MPTDPTGGAILVGAWAALIGAIAYLIRSTGPKLFELWVSAKIRSDEYRRTREEASGMAQKEFLSDILEHIAEERRADRDQRNADREEAKLAREQNGRLIEAIAQITARVGQASDRVTILTQQVVRQNDDLGDLKGDIRHLIIQNAERDGRPVPLAKKQLGTAPTDETAHD